MRQVKSWRSAGAAALLSGLLPLAGCAVHAVGLIGTGPGGVSLATTEGNRWRLVLNADDKPLGHLSDYQAEVWGTRVFKTVHVTDWKVPEGLHGLETWVGTLEARGVQLGLQDRNTGAYYILEKDPSGTLDPLVGHVVVVEGIVVGAHEVRALYYRDLSVAVPSAVSRQPSAP